jgi:ketosteroid isomerase-like protein
MSRCVAFLVAAVCLMAACGPTANVEQEREALLKLDREWSQSAKDVDKFVTYYSADAAVFPQGMPMVAGAGPIKETFTQLNAMPGFALQFSPTKADVGSSGDLGYVTGTYEMTLNDPAGKPATEKGKYVEVWKKQGDGQWKVAADIFNADGPPPESSQHTMVGSPKALTWVDAPPGLPPGGKMAVLYGNPTQPGPYVLRAQLPAGYKVPPHWHPTAEHLTILSGTLSVGMGETADAGAMKDFGANGYVVMPAEMRHYVTAKTATTFQIHGNGPFAINYVNPADDPRSK